MSDISKVKVGGVIHNIKDSAAHNALAKKQDALVSGTNIKTINGKSILGAGDIVVQGGGGSGTVTVSKVGETGNYNDLLNKPVIPSKTSQLTNDSGFLTQHQDISNLALKSDLDKKQDTLRSGVNIKTINGASILGNGDISIQGGGGGGTANGPKFVYLQGNSLTSSSFSKSNTTYIIRNEMTASGDITLPANCTLKFEGGCINGGRLIGNNASIEAGKTLIFKSVTIAGTWLVPNIYQDWFNFTEASVSSTTDNRKNFENMVALSSENIANNIFVNAGTWMTSKKDGLFFLKSNTVFHSSGEIKVLPNNDRDGSIFVIKGKKGDVGTPDVYTHDVHIIGGILTGDVDTHTMSNPSPDETDEHNHGVRIAGYCYNITVNGVISRKMHGDGLEVISSGDDVHHVTFENCIADGNGRQGLSIEAGKDIIVRNCRFINTGSHKHILPGCGIDVEPWIDGVNVQNIIIEYCTFENNVGGDILLLPCEKLTGPKKNFGCVIRHCRFKKLAGNNFNGISIEYCDVAPEGSMGFLGVSNCIIENSSKFELTLNQCKDIKVEYCGISSSDLNESSGTTCENIKFEHCKVDTLMFYGSKHFRAFRCTLLNIVAGIGEDVVFDKCEVFKIRADWATIKSTSFKNCDLHFASTYSQTGSINFYDCDFLFDDGSLTVQTDGVQIARCRFKTKNITNTQRPAVMINGVGISVSLIDNEYDGYECLYMRNNGTETVKVRTTKPMVINGYDNTYTPLAGCMDIYLNDVRLYTGKHWVYIGTRSGTACPEIGEYIGDEYFDTAKNKKLFWNGVHWIDAMGNPILKQADENEEPADGPQQLNQTLKQK